MHFNLLNSKDSYDLNMFGRLINITAICQFDIVIRVLEQLTSIFFDDLSKNSMMPIAFSS